MLHRLRKGPRPPVSESEAKAAEDIPAASADEEEAPQAATPLSHQEAVLEKNVTVTDPPARQVEVENLWSPHQPKHQKSAKPLIPLLLFLRLLPVLSSTIMLSTGLRYRSQSQDCPGLQVLHQHLDPSMSMGSEQTTHS